MTIVDPDIEDIAWVMDDSPAAAEWKAVGVESWPERRAWELLAERSDQPKPALEYPPQWREELLASVNGDRALLICMVGTASKVKRTSDTMKMHEVLGVFASSPVVTAEDWRRVFRSNRTPAWVVEYCQYVGGHIDLDHLVHAAGTANLIEQIMGRDFGMGPWRQRSWDTIADTYQDGGPWDVTTLLILEWMGASEYHAKRFVRRTIKRLPVRWEHVAQLAQDGLFPVPCRERDLLWVARAWPGGEGYAHLVHSPPASQPPRTALWMPPVNGVHPWRIAATVAVYTDTWIPPTGEELLAAAAAFTS